jgi:hypothetical protein
MSIDSVGAVRGGVAVRLWRRAPLWRLAVLSAVFLSLLFLLFPESQTGRRVSEPLASYAPPAATPIPTAPATPLPAQPQAPGARLPSAPASPSLAVSAPLAHAPGPPSTGALTMTAPTVSTTASAPPGDTAAMGQTYTGSIRTDGYTVPLPPGSWTVIVDQTSKVSIRDGAGSGRQLYLAKILNHELTGVVRILALRRTAGTLVDMNEASLPPAKCEPVKPDDPGHWKCAAVIYHYLGHWAAFDDRAARLTSGERAAGGELTAKGITIPQDFLSVLMFRSEAWGALETEYMFSPSAEGIRSNPTSSSQDSDWAGDKASATPRRAAYTKKIGAWGTAVYPSFKAAFAASAPTGGQPNSPAGPR